MDDNLIFYGGEIKAVGSGKVAGYLIRYSDPTTPDLTGDFFAAGTDYGVVDGASLPVYYQHGLDPEIKANRIGRGVIKYDEVGLWFEAQLEMRNEYEKMIYALAEQGKLGLSSGAAGHLVEREAEGKSYRIKTWPIAEASLTPTPAEPRNSVMPIKSLIEADAKGEEVEIESIESVQTSEPEKAKESSMDEKELQALTDKFGEMATAAANTAAEQAVKKYAELQEPEIKAGFVTQISDEADRALAGNPFRKGEFFKAVMEAANYPQNTDKRLLPLKATGLNEAIPSQGGFLVTQDRANYIWEKMSPVGSLLSRFSATPVQGNGLVIPAVDETSRADGSQFGGISASWMAEGGTYSASKPAFSTIDIKLNKVGALVVATDELLSDGGALESWLMSRVPDVLRFKVEKAIMSGDGVGKPLGILNSGALKSATRDGANLIIAGDIGRMWEARWQGANDYVWFASPTIFNQLMTMSISNMPVYVPPSGLDADPYGRLLGRPVVETEYNPSLGVVGDLLLASPSQYALITKGGVETASSIHVYFSTGEQAFRFTARFGGQPFWTTTLASNYASTDTFSPFVALAATT